MRVASKLGIRILPVACHNELSTINSLLAHDGMDTRNITSAEPSLIKIQEYIHKKEQLNFLQDQKIGQIRKIALAEMILDECLYPGERTSKYTMSPMAGGLFRGWDSDDD